MVSRNRPFVLQIWMHNPDVFPENPIQWTNAVNVTVVGGRVEFQHYGVPNGMKLSVTCDERRRVLIPRFTIDGM